MRALPIFFLFAALLPAASALAQATRAAAGELQAAGLIEYSRGRITVLDRKRLEKRVCECYAVVKTEYDRLLPARASAALSA